MRPEEEFEFIRTRRDQATELVRSSALPLLATQTGRRLNIIGSCFLLQLGSDVLLVSAAHVFYHASQEESQERFLVFGGDERGGAVPGVVPLWGRLAQSSVTLWADDPHDVAAILLDKRVAKVLRTAPRVFLNQVDPELRQSDVLPEAPGEDPFTMYGLVGFPSSRLNLARRGPKLTQAAVWGPSVLLGSPMEPGPIPATLLLIRFDPARMAGNEHRPIAVPKPQGMSGGPVWRCTFREGRAPEVKLVGMAIEYRKELRCIVVSRIAVIFNLIRHSFPQIADRLPGPPSYEPDIFNGGTF